MWHSQHRDTRIWKNRVDIPMKHPIPASISPFCIFLWYVPQPGYAVSLISDKDAHALRGIIEVMRRTNQDLCGAEGRARKIHVFAAPKSYEATNSQSETV